MRKRNYSLTIILLLIAIPTAWAAVGSGVCLNFLNGNIMSDTCGTSVTSYLGHGSVEVCGDCYVCGAADGICPEDFVAPDDGDPTTRERPYCQLCADPDCPITVEGYVESDTGSMVGGARVVIEFAHHEGNANYTHEVTTDSTGYYAIPNVPRGQFILYVIKADLYVTSEQIINPAEQISSHEENVTLIRIENDKCDAACTKYSVTKGYRVCEPACNNVEGCTFEGTQTYTQTLGPDITFDPIEVCANQRSGRLIHVGDDAVGNPLFYRCCIDSMGEGVIQDDRLTVANTNQTAKNILVAQVNGQLSETGEKGALKLIFLN